jgi:hypothetical protein
MEWIFSPGIFLVILTQATKENYPERCSGIFLLVVLAREIRHVR